MITDLDSWDHKHLVVQNIQSSVARSGSFRAKWLLLMHWWRWNFGGGGFFISSKKWLLLNICGYKSEKWLLLTNFWLFFNISTYNFDLIIFFELVKAWKEKINSKIFQHLKKISNFLVINAQKREKNGPGGQKIAEKIVARKVAPFENLWL